MAAVTPALYLIYILGYARSTVANASGRGLHKNELTKLVIESAYLNNDIQYFILLNNLRPLPSLYDIAILSAPSS